MAFTPVFSLTIPIAFPVSVATFFTHFAGNCNPSPITSAVRPVAYNVLLAALLTTVSHPTFTDVRMAVFPAYLASEPAAHAPVVISPSSASDSHRS